MKKAIILGLDGFDPKLIRRLIKKGQLPNFKRLIRSGTFSNLETTTPPESPVVWTTIATGQNPGEHGIFDFITKDKKNFPTLSIPKYKKSFFNKNKTVFHNSFDSKTFWEVLSENRIQSTVVKWPCTFPARKINGKIVAGMGIPDPDLTLGRYTLFTKEDFASKEKLKGKIIQLKFENKTSKFKNISLSIISKTKVLLAINKKEHVLQTGNWSPWIEVDKGISRFYLNSIYPNFSLYQSAVNPTFKKTDFPLSYPTNYLDYLFEKLGFFHTLGLPEETNGIVDGLITKKTFINFSEIIFEERERLFFHHLEKLDKGLLAFVFDSIDRFQHIFGQGKETILFYKRVDKIIGKILKKINNKTLLTIVSDHGFVPFKKVVHLNTFLKKKKYLSLKGNRKTSPYLFENVDWNKTKAFALGFSSIYINDKYRKTFPYKKFTKDLYQITDPENNKKVIKRIYLKSEIYKGRFLKDAPDFVVGTIPPYRISSETAVGGITKNIIDKNEKDWGFDHIVDKEFVPGLFLTNQKLSKIKNVEEIFNHILSFFNINNYQ